MSSSYAFGDFSFMKDDLWRVTLTEDFAIITNLDLWKALKNHDSSKPFMFDLEWNINLSNSHSGLMH